VAWNGVEREEPKIVSDLVSPACLGERISGCLRHLLTCMPTTATR
jgi:hypothetical protein